MYNHGRTQTRGAHSLSVLACGSLQRFERAGVEEKRHDAHEGDAVLVCPGLFVRVAGHHDLSEVVPDVAKRKGLLFALFVVGDVPCGLDVEAHVAFVDDEIHFIPLAATLAVDGREHLHGADVHGIAAADEFVVDRVFHEMRVLALPEVEPRIADAGVDGVVFGRVVEVAVAAQVEEPGVTYEKGRFKIAEIFAYGRLVASELAGRVYRVREFRRIRKASDIAHCSVGDGFKKIVVSEIEPLDYVAEVDGRVEVVEILTLFGFRLKKRTFGKSAEGKIGVAYLEEVPCAGHRLGKLGERKRSYGDDFAASPELGGYIFRKQFCVGSGNIRGDIGALEQSVEHVVEGDVCIVAVFGAQTGKIRAFGKNRLRMLYFVDEDETRGIVGGKAGAYFLAECYGIAAESQIVGFKVDFNDVAGADARIKKMLLEEGEKEKTLSATAHPHQNLDEIMALCLDQLVQKDVSLDGHSDSPALCASARKFKTRISYQIGLHRSIETLNLRASAHKFKATSRFGRKRTELARFAACARGRARRVRVGPWFKQNDLERIKL